LRLLALGMNNKQVARALAISVRTVEVHRATTMRKLGADSLAALVRYAIRTGLVKP
jgi:DNA-binding NarL/FixJ family response regulator